MEAGATGRARVRPPRVAPSRPGRLRGQWVVVACPRSRRLRRPPTRHRRLHRREHVPHEGGHHGHAAPACRTRSRLNARDDLPAPSRACGPGRSSGTPEVQVRGAAIRNAVVSFYTPEEMLAMVREAGFSACGTSRGRLSASVTLGIAGRPSPLDGGGLRDRHDLILRKQPQFDCGGSAFPARSETWSSDSCKMASA